MSNYPSSSTLRLIKRKFGFFEGFASMADFGEITEHYNSDISPSIADRNSIASDWKVVGEDINQALKSHE